LIDITAVDYPSKNPRFAVFYQFISIQYNQRFMVKVLTDGVTPLISLSSLYNSSNWLEREVWDLFGIFFSEHPDLRRILTDYGFQGFPMRKDFPLSGFVEIAYSDEMKKVIYLPLELTQEYRFFDFSTSWQ
jgi:NADH/F420H2 dehydrogenase subunit C